MLYFGGILPLSIALLLTVLVNTLGLATTYWLSIWVGAYEKGGKVDVAFYAGIYALIINALAVTEAITGAVYQRGAWAAGRRLHQAMTRAVVGAPLSWWKDVPVGRVINRFSQDVKSLYVLPHVLCAQTVANPPERITVTSHSAAWFPRASTC
jgi:hypothetical protein